jgi:2-octaprenyl-6-methoxyphenol hydroxylase
MSKVDTDVVVVGGGLTGVAAAIAAAKAGYRTVHLAPMGPPDRRTSALMGPSVDYLQSAGLIADPEELGHPLTQIRIIDATERLIRAPETLFDATEAGMTAFGWNFANTRLLERFQTVASTLVTLETRNVGVTGLQVTGDAWQIDLSDGGSLRTSLVVGADGKKSTVRSQAGFTARETAFEQAALVADLDLGRPIGGTSVEFHYANGPFTLVPAGGNRANLVWIDTLETLKAAQAGGPDALVGLIRAKSQRLFGTVEIVSGTHVFPLSTLTVDGAGGGGVVLVGEAAHAFPPIGAQGLNLGLRDVADLATALQQADRSRADWAIALSQSYAEAREADLGRTGAMVDALFRSLLAEMLPAQAARASGLWALRSLPTLRRQAFAVGMGRN